MQILHTRLFGDRATTGSLTCLIQLAFRGLARSWMEAIKICAKELGLSRGEADGLVDYLCGVGYHQAIHFLWRPALSDPRDEFILELAVAAQCDAIVTHNVRDFAGATRFGVTIVTPGDFLAAIEEEV